MEKIIGDIETNSKWSNFHQRQSHQRIVATAIEFSNITVIRYMDPIFSDKPIFAFGLLTGVRVILFHDDTVVLCKLTGDQVRKTF